MKKAFTILFLLVIILQSCGDDPTQFKKDRVIPESKLVNLLIDFHLMDALTNSSEFYRKFENIDSVDMYSDIFKKYGVSREEFDTTLAIYSREPELYLEIYDKVMLELNLRIDELEKESEQALNDQATKSPEQSDQNLKKREMKDIRSKR